LHLAIGGVGHHTSRGHESTAIPRHVGCVPRHPERVIAPPHRIDHEIVIASIDAIGSPGCRIEHDDLGLIDHEHDTRTVRRHGRRRQRPTFGGEQPGRATVERDAHEITDLVDHHEGTTVGPPLDDSPAQGPAGAHRVGREDPFGSAVDRHHDDVGA
jgi:hypothetical protein